jgi:hypothetical protein
MPSLHRPIEGRKYLDKKFDRPNQIGGNRVFPPGHPLDFTVLTAQPRLQPRDALLLKFSQFGVKD